MYDDLTSPYPFEIICSQRLLWDTQISLRREYVHLSKGKIQGEPASHHHSATRSVALRHSPWLSESIGPGRTLFFDWPCWCVISNNLSKCLIGSALFIEQRHLFPLTPSSPMLQENCQMILNEGQLAPFSKCRWAKLWDVIQTKLSGAEHKGREMAYG